MYNMTSSVTIESLEQLLISKCYYYAYVDDNGIRGTLDKSLFKPGPTTTRYSYKKNGVQGKIYTTEADAKFEANLMRKPEDKILVESIELDTLQLYDESFGRNTFVKGIGMRKLYLLKDDGIIDSNDGIIHSNDGIIDSSKKEVIGTVVSRNDRERDKKKSYNVFENLSNKTQNLSGSAETEPVNQPATQPATESVNDEYQVYINNVDIENDSQGKHLCKIMVQLFLLNANASADEKLSFCLNNAGGLKSCMCYTRAFKKCGYKVFGYIDERYGRGTITIKKEMEEDLCNAIYGNQPFDTNFNFNSSDTEFTFDMGFVYTGESGGKRTGSKRKNRKTKKSRKNKTRKNKTRKNKTRKNKTRKNKTMKK